jgi:ADP-ribosylglycohydrolase
MEDNATTMVLASFAGDSLALGVHWIYDTARIASQFGRVENYLEPGGNSYHPTKGRGEFTHYGDQELVLLESVATRKGFDLGDFAERWRNLFQDYNGYYDAATKGTLRNFSKGKTPENSASPSNDLAGASRIAPLVYCYRDDLDTLVKAVVTQTRMTHGDALTVRTAEFFARVSWNCLRGVPPSEAINRITQDMYKGTIIDEWIQEGLESKTLDSVEAISNFGQSCHTPDAFPGVVHLMTKFENDLKEALVQAVMAGGDNAARAMMVGTVLGAYLGDNHLPQEWVANLKKEKEIKDFLEQIG